MNAKTSVLLYACENMASHRFLYLLVPNICEQMSPEYHSSGVARQTHRQYFVGTSEPATYQNSDQEMELSGMYPTETCFQYYKANLQWTPEGRRKHGKPKQNKGPQKLKYWQVAAPRYKTVVLHCQRSKPIQITCWRSIVHKKKEEEACKRILLLQM